MAKPLFPSSERMSCQLGIGWYHLAWLVGIRHMKLAAQLTPLKLYYGPGFTYTNRIGSLCALADSIFHFFDLKISVNYTQFIWAVSQSRSLSLYRVETDCCCVICSSLLFRTITDRLGLGQCTSVKMYAARISGKTLFSVSTFAGEVMLC